MKKSTKLLSILLAILMIFSSVSVVAFAAKAKYKTADDLTAMETAGKSPFSGDGEVTRLDTETRMSMILDTLDEVLEAANINPGTLFSAMGLSLTVDLRSVDKLCGTIDGVQSLLNNGLVGGVKWMLGIIADVNVGTWQSGMTRDKTAQLTIVNELVEFINANKGVIANVITTGTVDLGVASSALGGVDLSMLKDLPALIKGMIFPLFNRVDDTTAEADARVQAIAGPGKLLATLEPVVKNLLLKSQKYTAYWEDASGKALSNHKLPDMTSDTRLRLEKGKDATGEYYVCHTYVPRTDANAAKVWNPEKDAEGEIVKYYKTAVNNAEGKFDHYVYQTKTGAQLKYHEVVNPTTMEGTVVPSLAKDMKANAAAYDLNTKSVADMFYRALPFVFQDLAPVVLNGSIKKLLAEWFGARFNFVGTVNSDAVKAKPYYDANNALFKAEHPAYTFDWSDYAVFNGTHVWRFRDDIYEADLANTNDFFNLLNWNYEIKADFFNEFIPKKYNPSSTSTFDTMFQSLNNFVAKFLKEVLAADMYTAINWKSGDNTKLLENAKSAARAIVGFNPKAIFGEHYYEDAYYQMMMTGKLGSKTLDDQALSCAIAVKLLEFLMPQLILPAPEEVAQMKIGTMFAYIIREVTTQLLPSNNYDALIFTDYNKRTFLKGAEYDNNYWLDVCLTMAMDIGMHYMQELTDLGDGDKDGYQQKFPKATYTLEGFKKNTRAWEAKLDWFIDFALSNKKLWSWNGENLVEVGNVNLATDEDPWVKLGNLFKLLPLDQIFNVDYKNDHWLEVALRDKLVLGLLDLKLDNLVGGATANGLLNVPQSSVLRTKGLFPAATDVVRSLVNNLFYKIGGNVNLLDPATFVTLDDVLNQANLGKLVTNLITMIYNAINANKNVGGLLQFALPIVNNFVGWKTARQEMAQPSIMISNSLGKGYAFTGRSAKNSIKIRNTSSGMLEKNGGKIDNPYNMVIENVTVDNGTITGWSKNQVLSPGEALALDFAPATNEKTARIEVQYYFTFKDAAKTKLSGTQTATFYVYVSAKESDLNQRFTLNLAKNFTASGTANPVIKDVADVEKVVKTVGFTLDNTSKSGYGRKDREHRFREFNTNYFVRTRPETGLYAGQGGNSSVKVNPLGVKKGVDFKAQFTAGEKIGIRTLKVVPTYGLTQYPAQKDLGSLVFVPDTTALKNLFNSLANLQKLYFKDADAEWTALQKAMADAAFYVQAPMVAADFDDIDANTGKSPWTQAKVDACYKNLQNAVKALNAKPSNSGQAALQTAMDKYDKGQDYQDYELYSYFKFNDERQWNNRMLGAYIQPVAPDKYITGSNMAQTAIEAVANKEANTQLKNAILASMNEPTQAMKDAYEAAKLAYKAPTYTNLQIADAAAKIGFYEQFLKAKTTDKSFLQKEIASAEAQKYVQADYSADSWAVYEKALANARAAEQDAKALQSTCFNVKYELQVAQNDLVLKEDSCKENGYYDKLNSLIAQADAMFANAASYTLKANAGVDAATAWAELVEALGYVYTDENQVERNLYPSSAKAFVASDRVIGMKAEYAISEQIAKLQKAMDRFEVVVKLDAATSTAKVNNDTRIVTGVAPATINTAQDLIALVKAANAADTVTAVETGMGFGTGSVVTVTDAKGNKTAYTLVIYGDVNGDGSVDMFDASIMDMYLNGKLSLNGYFNTAADVANNASDGNIDIADYNAIAGAAVGRADLVQAR